MKTPEMTLHDYFMAHAPFTMSDAENVLLRQGNKETSVRDIIKSLCLLNSSYADAMIELREKEAKMKIEKEGVEI